MNYPPPENLWAMEPRQFNEWRSQNDIPVLMEYLSKLLPRFGEWLETLPFDSYVINRFFPTGSLFKGDTSKIAYERPGDIPGEKIYECRDILEEDPVTWWALRQKTIQVLGIFEPYFLWAKKNLKKQRFFTINLINQQQIDTFEYRSWSGLNVDGCITRANLFYDFVVLKLGQFKLPRGLTFCGRNLDFTDLDFLEINGDGHGSAWTTINYSSCREFSIENSEMYFLTFHQCRFQKFSCSNSKIQDVYFEKSDISEFYLSNSMVYRMGFSSSNITPFISDCEIREVNYIPPKNLSPSIIASTFRLLRSAYQNSGLRQESAHCYYNERIYERKAYFHPISMNKKLFPGIEFEGRLSFVWKLWGRNLIKEKDIFPIIKKALLSKIKLWLLPKLAFRMIGFRLKWLSSLFEYVIWGYGERPSRIFSCAAMIIFIYAYAFHASNWMGGKNLDWVDSFYFSVVTFTTLGYGDITPSTEFLKILCASEAILGAFTIGLIVAGFSNRSRY